MTPIIPNLCDERELEKQAAPDDNGIDSGDRTFDTASFVPDPVPLGAIYGLFDIESAQVAFEVLPQDRRALIDRFGIEVLAARPMMVDQRLLPN